ncbi:flagellar motor switch protein FliN [Roseibium denhamense]|uniref:Flagellar motor switch protein FliN n=2 Tax=Roseibium denhamense TaxID=76305 RepID=A0ABY1PEX7_9HYPH|nr:flagellar motor switch protein FliN [Roseibium denhamense]MTI06224.1 flagellar motor switch protein FliN [Roseibium denhamense]SMP32700.1 flagellar motor switch protein FliN/FliY [Roseibium denhamense]
MSDTIIDHVSTDAAEKTKTASSADFAKVEMPEPENIGATMGDDKNLDTILGIPVNIQVVLGSATMLVSNLLKLGRGAVIPLNHRVGEPIDIVVNGRVIARGEVVVVEDDNSRFGVSLTEIINSQSGALEV